MRRMWLTTLAVLIALPVAAETPFECAPGATTKLSFSAGRDRVRHAGTFVAPAGFDPLTAGLTVTLAYEPETDPANTLLTVTVPASRFLARRNGVVFRDRTGSLGGLHLVRISDKRGAPAGTKQVRINRRGTPIAGATHAGSLRLVLESGPACVRTCTSACTAGDTLRCQPSTDAALCGLISGCDPLNVIEGAFQAGTCMFPYPSDFFQEADPSTPTGKRHAYTAQAMPANTSGVHIDPVDYATLDGFSPGALIHAHWAQGVDLVASNIPSLTNFAASVGSATGSLLIEADAAGCQRVEHFGENDVSAGLSGPVTPPRQAFLVRPGRRLKNATRYIVALRGLVGQDTQPILPGTAFAALRDGTPSGNAAVEARRPAFNALFGKLESDCGVPRSSLVLAWDFTTASDDNLTRWLVHMRDETFAGLGSAAPAFVVDTVEDDPFGDPRVCRRVRGRYTVPLYMTANAPGARLVFGPGGLPAQNGVATDVPFTAIIPCSLVSPAPAPGRPIFYGHGLLGSGSGEVSAGNLRTLANTYGFVLVATDWQGMSNADLGTVFGLVGDLSAFPKLPERLHQGILNQLVLARLLKASNGLSAHPAFRYATIAGDVSVIDPSEVFYYGNSQGGIFGGTVMALEQEVTRGVLGVPGANFSTLLHRSRDFEPYFLVLKGGYPDDLVRHFTLALIEELWQRAEPLGWYHHTLAGDLPATPAKKVLVHMATADDEVANIATEIMVRSMGMPQVAPVVQSYYGIAEASAPFDGSAMVESDEGDTPAPVTNIPPADNNAHGAMRGRPAIQAQIDRFLRTGGDVQNFCVGPCNPE